MREKVRALRKNGRLVWAGPAEATTPGVAGMLTIDEKRDPALGRTMPRAKLTGITAGSDTDLLPELLDVQLLWAREQKMRLTGFEHIDNVAYAQTWAIEVMPC